MSSNATLTTASSGVKMWSSAREKKMKTIDASTERHRLSITPARAVRRMPEMSRSPVLLATRMLTAMEKLRYIMKPRFDMVLVIW